MPKLVDHNTRRNEIVRAVWSLIARSGLDGVTMRQLAAEAGYANGALAPYFRGKDDILLAAYQHAVDATNARAAIAIDDRRGLAALRLLCYEIMPLDEERLREARVVIAFWDRAAHDERLATVHAEAVATWHDQMLTYLRQARQDGEIDATPDTDRRTVDTLLTTMMGFQINAVLAPGHLTPERQLAVLETILPTPRQPAGEEA